MKVGMGVISEVWYEYGWKGVFRFQVFVWMTRCYGIWTGLDRTGHGIGQGMEQDRIRTVLGSSSSAYSVLEVYLVYWCNYGHRWCLGEPDTAWANYTGALVVWLLFVFYGK